MANDNYDSSNLNANTHDGMNPKTGDEIGEAAGGVSGVITGAALGSLGGPIGTIIGGIAGAIGGWWAGKEISEAARSYTDGDDTYYRDHFEHSDARVADQTYGSVQPAYQLGHVAGQNPDYRGKPFESVEPDLRRGWDSSTSAAHGDWEKVRGYARDAYSRSSGLNLHSRPHHLTDEQDAAASNDDNRIDDVAGFQRF